MKTNIKWSNAQLSPGGGGVGSDIDTCITCTYMYVHVSIYVHHECYNVVMYVRTCTVFVCTVYFLLVADTTGVHSVYTEFRDSEIMFHVSTLLPHTPSNKQQVSYVQVVCMHGESLQ